MQMNTSDFTKQALWSWEHYQCGHGTYTGDQCPEDAVARVAPKNAPWFKRFRCEAHADDYMADR